MEPLPSHPLTGHSYIHAERHTSNTAACACKDAAPRRQAEAALGKTGADTIRQVRGTQGLANIVWQQDRQHRPGGCRPTSAHVNPPLQAPAATAKRGNGVRASYTRPLCCKLPASVPLFQSACVCFAAVTTSDKSSTPNPCCALRAASIAHTMPHATPNRFSLRHQPNPSRQQVPFTLLTEMGRGVPSSVKGRLKQGP